MIVVYNKILKCLISSRLKSTFKFVIRSWSATYIVVASLLKFCNLYSIVVVQLKLSFRITGIVPRVKANCCFKPAIFPSIILVSSLFCSLMSCIICCTAELTWFKLDCKCFTKISFFILSSVIALKSALWFLFACRHSFNLFYSFHFYVVIFNRFSEAKPINAIINEIT